MHSMLPQKLVSYSITKLVFGQHRTLFRPHFGLRPKEHSPRLRRRIGLRSRGKFIRFAHGKLIQLGADRSVHGDASTFDLANRVHFLRSWQACRIKVIILFPKFYQIISPITTDNWRTLVKSWRGREWASGASWWGDPLARMSGRGSVLPCPSSGNHVLVRVHGLPGPGPGSSGPPGQRLTHRRHLRFVLGIVWVILALTFCQKLFGTNTV